MLQEDLHLIEKTYANLQRSPQQFITGLYANFFALAPHMRKKFPLDLRKLQTDVGDAFATIARNVDNADIIAETVHTLIKRHQQFGMSSEHYLVARDALMRTLKQQRGEEFDWNAREAWSNFCDYVWQEARAANEPGRARRAVCAA